ncbi:MAG: hypothetical protein R6U19_01340 [Bacteroidales bacterium]
MKMVLKIFAALALFVSIVAPVKAQDAQQAANAYNWALKNYKDDINASIDSLERFNEIATGLLEEEKLEGKQEEQIQKLQKKAHKYLPTFYYMASNRLYRQMRTDMAIEKFKETIEVAKKFDNQEIIEKSENVLPKVYYKSASDAMQMMDYQKAADLYGKAAEYDPDWAKAYMKKALALQKQENYGKMMETIRQTIKVAQETENEEVQKRAIRIAQNYYWSIGANAISEGENEEALTAFKKALEFDKEDSYAYYYLALAKNKLLKYSEAVEDAEKGLALLKNAEEEDKEQEARLRLQLGIAEASLGKAKNGCENIKKAQYGKTDEKARREYEAFECPPPEE